MKRQSNCDTLRDWHGSLHDWVLRGSGLPPERLAHWLDGMNSAILTAMRTLDDIEVWTGRAENVMAQLSGRTPVALRRAFS
jgi:hypothetical protein